VRHEAQRQPSATRPTIGGSYRWVVSSFRTFNDAWLLTVRFAF
jgi:hypothetical protein